MNRRLKYISMAVLMLAAGGVYWAVRAPADTQVVTDECDSCSARKQDMARMREVLNPPKGQGD